MLPSRRLARQPAHQLLKVSLGQRRQRLRPRARDQTPQPAVGRLVVGQQQQLVAGVEIDQVARLQPLLQLLLPTVVDPHPQKKMLAQRRIVEPPLLLDRHQRRDAPDVVGEEPAAQAERHAGLRVDFDALHAAGG